jgi:general L-amino acid transport system permease protein
MAVTSEDATQTRPSGGGFWSNPAKRGLVFQAVVTIAFVLFVVYIVNNTASNLEKRGIASGFDFLELNAGFDVGMSPFLKYDAATATHMTVLIVGVLNTLLVAVIGNILATILGFIVGVLRLTPNWLVSRIAYCYVEIVRNVPLLLQLLFWYFAVLGVLPLLRDSIVIGDSFFLSNRGLFGPKPVPEDGFWIIPTLFVLGIIAAFIFTRWAKGVQDQTGKQYPVISINIGLVIGLPILGALAMGFPLTFENPELGRFNISGGFVIYPEFMGLLIGLTMYHAAFIAEIVRAGILSVSHGQTEASSALGVRPNITMRLIILPQALRVIVPPLTSMYLNLTKNSSLAVAIGGSEIVAIFMGTSLNQTGQAIEIIAITMGFYMTMSLLISLFMNWYNQRIAIVER